ncbi:Protein of unknown function [Pyronema omphalodes CBS 100304]|uniref:Uncharacterized protein n=1 Tax=Pyronema omphalodes (strain CBS 100304) TaxID=1076935 RepID=U4L991_PYROM|nr:Protein of unknown function [Pyronema omphalodes CBS 100304]
MRFLTNFLQLSESPAPNQHPELRTNIPNTAFGTQPPITPRAPENYAN